MTGPCSQVSERVSDLPFGRGCSTGPEMFDGLILARQVCCCQQLMALKIMLLP